MQASIVACEKSRLWEFFDRVERCVPSNAGRLSYAAQDEKKRQLAFGDLVNALEVACAIFRDKLFFGRAGDVLEHYLLSTFRLIEANDDARARMLNLLQTPRTFENTVEFLRQHRGQGLPSV